MQALSVAVTGALGCVAVSVAAKMVGRGVVVGNGCVGGMAVGGRNGVGVFCSAQAEAERMMSGRSRLTLRKRRLCFINKKWTRWACPLDFTLCFFVSAAYVAFCAVAHIKR